MKRRIFITGSNGYIGNHLTQHLLRLPDVSVIGFNRRFDEKLPADQQIVGDLLEVDLLSTLEAIKPDLVFHTIGSNPKSPFSHQLSTNVEGTRRLLQSLIDTGMRPKTIVLGSAAEYGLRDTAVDEQALCNPDGEYGISKLAQTQVAQSFARRYDLPVMIARIFNVYGQTERHLAVAAMANQITRAETGFPDYSELHVHNLRSRRDFVHISDVVRALVALAATTSMNETSGQIYNIGTGKSISLSTVLDTLLGHSTLGAEALRKVSLRLHGAQREDVSQADIVKIRQHTGWTPQVPLRSGLREELAYWREKAIVPLGFA